MPMQKIEIFDTDATGALAFDLRDVLALVEVHRALRWYILDLEAMAELKDGETIMEIEQNVAKSPHGVEIEWGRLRTLADQIMQTINTTIAGCDPGAPEPSLPINLQFGVRIVIEAIDSTLWAISTDDQQAIQRAQTTFKKTKLLTLTE